MDITPRYLAKRFRLLRRTDVTPRRGFSPVSRIHEVTTVLRFIRSNIINGLGLALALQ
jgi:hypothetical protein